MVKLARVIVSLTPIALLLTKTGSVFAQSATSGATSGALPSAGTTGLTYFLFLGGVGLFVFGTLKLLLSFRD